MGGALPPRPRSAPGARRSGLRRRLPAGSLGRADGDAAAETPDSHGPPAGGPLDPGVVVVAVAGSRDEAADRTRSRLAKICPCRPDRAGAANRPGRLDQHQLCGRGLSRPAHLPEFLVAEDGFPRRLRAVARTRRQLRGRRPLESRTRRHSLHSSPGCGGGGLRLDHFGDHGRPRQEPAAAPGRAPVDARGGAADLPRSGHRALGHPAAAGHIAQCGRRFSGSVLRDPTSSPTSSIRPSSCSSSAGACWARRRPPRPRLPRRGQSRPDVGISAIRRLR